jgi:hypothetical protein
MDLDEEEIIVTIAVTLARGAAQVSSTQAYGRQTEANIKAAIVTYQERKKEPRPLKIKVIRYKTITSKNTS